MTAETFCELLGEINEKHIVQAAAAGRPEKRLRSKRWAVAACVCLLAVAAIGGRSLLSAAEPYPAQRHETLAPVTPEQPATLASAAPARTPWTLRFNEPGAVLGAQRPMIKGIFTEALSAEELAALQPQLRFSYMTCSGYAEFDTYGTLLRVIMRVATTLPERPVTVSVGDYAFDALDSLRDEAAVSVCGGVEFRAYQYDSGAAVTLAADAVINDLLFSFSMAAEKSQLERAKADFKDVLECFAYYDAGLPDLTVVTAEEIPELTEQFFDSLSEARTEPDFGRYLPQELPDGFGDDLIRRFRFGESDSLSGHWTNGLDYLSWVVSPCTAADARRITAVDERENYDLSLYPVPRAESVPDELREIVNNPVFEADALTQEAVWRRAWKTSDAGDTDGWRMRFGVRYGDVVVAVSSKGVDPEWLYRQLMSPNTK